ncbi:hypothetical protein ABZ805_23060 [Saccharopolyspora sp. NPDC047091]|uniref:hypothetical protein n=1 Tax=Saccharopolyspora sp. NPDC047091 TaxID=3155924 RepID=UPI0034100C20
MFDRLGCSSGSTAGLLDPWTGSTAGSFDRLGCSTGSAARLAGPPDRSVGSTAGLLDRRFC